MVPCSSLYIFHVIIKTREDFRITSSLYEKQIISSKKNYFWKKNFHWKNGSKDGEEDATKNRWDIYYSDLQETQKSPQSKEDQLLHIEEILSLTMKKLFFKENLMSENRKRELVKMVEIWATGME